MVVANVADPRVSASMRPRLNAGDDVIYGQWAIVRLEGFNEAPAKCRG